MIWAIVYALGFLITARVYGNLWNLEIWEKTYTIDIFVVMLLSILWIVTLPGAILYSIVKKVIEI